MNASLKLDYLEASFFILKLWGLLMPFTTDFQVDYSFSRECILKAPQVGVSETWQCL